MDAKPKVSIILPIYNTAEYLEKCLESILGQTYKELEIICVDDGSTDGSELILDRFAAKDNRIKAIHKKNGGESSARNAGISVMTGEYVGFMDCDDWVESDMYQSLVWAAVNYKVDLVASTWYFDEADISMKVLNQKAVSREVFGREKLLHYIYERDAYRGFAYLWDKLYKRDLFYDNEGKLFLFDEDLMLGGDVLYLAKLACNAQSAFYIDEAYYHYNQRNTSGCHTLDLNKREDWITAYKRLINYYEAEGIGEEILLWVKRFMAYHSSNVAEIAYEQKNFEVLCRCQKIMEQYKAEYIGTNQQYEDRIVRYEKILSYM